MSRLVISRFHCVCEGGGSGGAQKQKNNHFTISL